MEWDEAEYGRVRVQPPAFQDDILRVAQTTSSARVGAIKLGSMLRERLLHCHPTKTCYILVGNREFKANVRDELKEAPLKFEDFEMQEKAEYEYLGDIISSGGLAASVEATIGEFSSDLYRALACDIQKVIFSPSIYTLNEVIVHEQYGNK